MHIALLADPELPVPPRLYGGIERIVHSLARGLGVRGHEVTLFAHPDSQVDCELRPWRGRSSSSRTATALNTAQFAAFAAGRSGQGLIVHSFARLSYLTPLLPSPLPKIQSYQRHITPRSVRVGRLLSRGTLHFTACSASCAQSSGQGGISVIYNCVELSRYDFQAEVARDAPLMFLGRVERIKGAHHAIDVARRSGRRLIIAGNLPERGEDVGYAQSIVAQCDGTQIQYVGPVDDGAKNALLGSAACLLMPIEWDEPFGIVMAEAMACGTPVIGLRRGSVPEVVEHGVTGFVCDRPDDLIGAVQRVPELSRRAVRTAAETRFSADVIVDQYLDLYARARGA
jgi:glycosyltransferase involved in cell wall biosynthesis